MCLCTVVVPDGYNVASLFKQGVQIDITLWDFDPESRFLKYDMVDEFKYLFRDLPGTAAKLVTINGIRAKPSK